MLRRVSLPSVCVCLSVWSVNMPVLTYLTAGQRRTSVVISWMPSTFSSSFSFLCFLIHLELTQWPVSSSPGLQLSPLGSPGLTFFIWVPEIGPKLSRLSDKPCAD